MPLTSLNLPIAKDVLGARATRTTHPKVIRGFEDLFSAVLERDIAIRTPFQWLTKKEVTRKIVGHGFGHLLGTTSSCTRPRTRSIHKRHCGACSQCIDRRFGILAAGLGDLDPAERYELDLLLGDRSLDRDVRMAVAYVKFFQTFASSSKTSWPTATIFCVPTTRAPAAGGPARPRTPGPPTPDSSTTSPRLSRRTGARTPARTRRSIRGPCSATAMSL